LVFWVFDPIFLSQLPIFGGFGYHKLVDVEYEENLPQFSPLSTIDAGAKPP
jgi:hypothetical protein